MKINIAIGKSRKDLRWKNKEILWEQFVEKLKHIQRTHETFKEYLAFDKDRQAEIKDVGGFVGGHLVGGRRLKNAVLTRSLITLDCDTDAANLVERFQLHYDCRAVVYSTHKHEPGAERYRLIVPLSREVMTDEFTAISRKIAEQIGIDSVDRVSYMPHCIMYWPSTSKDGSYEFYELKGKFLDPETVLELYSDWTDISQWPISSKEKKLHDADAKKQGEPSEKPGLIGAFNRAYSIEDAIEMFIPDIYTKSDKLENRYTYRDGSTSDGAIVYDGKFLYSNHSTDPVSHVLCNAFDLVRLHKFGDQDLDTDPSVPVNKRPSYVRMSEFVSRDSLVKQQIGEAKLLEASDAFAGVPMPGKSKKPGKLSDYVASENSDWLSSLDVDNKGNYQNTLNNIVLILDNDPIFKSNIFYDEFENMPIFKRNVPWRKVKQHHYITDSDLANIENHIERVYKISAGDVKLNKAMLIESNKNKIHPVKSYLSGLKWDGVKRVEEMFVYYFGAEDNEYTRDVARKVMTAAVARIFNPGCKFDNIVVLVGEEGMGKSTFWSNLAGAWFSDTFNLGMLNAGVRAYEQLRGVWIIEIGELAGMAKAEVERVKNFVSASVDRYRAAFGRMTDVVKRCNIFVASVNTFDFLKSQDGNRRFWPVPVGVTNDTIEADSNGTLHDMKQERGVDRIFNMSVSDIDQLWAEAKMMYDKGESLHLTSESSKAVAKMMQQQFTEENPVSEIIEKFLEKDIPKNWYNLSIWEQRDIIDNYDSIDKTDFVQRDKVCKHEVWQVALGERGVMSLPGMRLIKSAMKNMPGWKKVSEAVYFGNYPRQKGSWYKPNSSINVSDLL